LSERPEADLTKAQEVEPKKKVIEVSSAEDENIKDYRTLSKQRYSFHNLVP
jgi:hypothetical protein